LDGLGRFDGGGGGGGVTVAAPAVGKGAAKGVAAGALDTAAASGPLARFGGDGALACCIRRRTRALGRLQQEWHHHQDFFFCERQEPHRAMRPAFYPAQRFYTRETPGAATHRHQGACTGR